MICVTEVDCIVVCNFDRLGEAEKAVWHYEQSGRKADRKDIDQAKALSTILSSCSEAQRVKDWTALLKQSQSALSLGSDSSPQVCFTFYCKLCL